MVVIRTSEGLKRDDAQKRDRIQCEPSKYYKVHDCKGNSTTKDPVGETSNDTTGKYEVRKSSPSVIVDDWIKLPEPPSPPTPRR